MVKKQFQDKKILIVGLGVLGGGVATTKWFLKRGAEITVTDLKSREELKKSICALGNDAKKIKFILGAHNEEDFKQADLIVVNPAVKILGNKFLETAMRLKKPVTNDLALFLDEVKNPIIAVTGTRGKTTTTNWIAHFLKAHFPKIHASGNSSDEALLALSERFSKDKKTPAVLELSSFQLEIANRATRAPDIAVVTNLYQDHINRHDAIKNYALAKANIYKNQTERQKLILNFDNEWARYFVNQKPKANVYFISLRPLPKNMNGVYVRGNTVVFRDGKKESVVYGEQTLKLLWARGEHNLYNFLNAALASFLAGVSWKEIEKRIATLPDIFLRQEIIIKKKNFIVVNDSAGTSPDAAIAALKRFSREGKIIFITGGTDKQLEFKKLADEIKNTIEPENLFFLNGSATRKLMRELETRHYFRNKKKNTFEDLKDVLLAAHKKMSGTYSHLPIIVLFSPGAASFEKFRNEFDRGEKFGEYSKQIFK